MGKTAITGLTLAVFSLLQLNLSNSAFGTMSGGNDLSCAAKSGGDDFPQIHFNILGMGQILNSSGVQDSDVEPCQVLSKKSVCLSFQLGAGGVKSCTLDPSSWSSPRACFRHLPTCSLVYSPPANAPAKTQAAEAIFKALADFRDSTSPQGDGGASDVADVAINAHGPMVTNMGSEAVRVDIISLLRPGMLDSYPLWAIQCTRFCTSGCDTSEGGGLKISDSDLFKIFGQANPSLSGTKCGGKLSSNSDAEPDAGAPQPSVPVSSDQN